MAGSSQRFSRVPNGAARSARSTITATGEVLHNAEGIDKPAPTFNAIHDISTQPRGFGYVSGIIDPTTRVVLDLWRLA